jgi:3-methyladenine DNA glycosylase/8-oxoguanine DNA glycosylase
LFPYTAIAFLGIVKYKLEYLQEIAMMTLTGTIMIEFIVLIIISKEDVIIRYISHLTQRNGILLIKRF